MKHYLIDSENVGDFWIPLLELPADQAELIVFYTKNSGIGQKSHFHQML